MPRNMDTIVPAPIATIKYRRPSRILAESIAPVSSVSTVSVLVAASVTADSLYLRILAVAIGPPITQPATRP